MMLWLLTAATSLSRPVLASIGDAPTGSLASTFVFDSDGTYLSALSACPALCSDTGSKANWTVYNSYSELNACKLPVLLEFAIFNPLDDSNPSSNRIFACTDAERSSVSKRRSVSSALSSKRAAPASGSSSCLVSPTQQTADVEVSWSSGQGSAGPYVVSAAKHVQSHLSEPATDCGAATLSFSHVNHTVVGLYVGSQVQNAEVAVDFMPKFMAQVSQNGGKTTMAQRCAGGDPELIVGAVSDTTGDLAAVQKVIRSWAEGKCVTALGGGKTTFQSKLVTGEPTNSTAATNSVTSTSTLNQTSSAFVSQKSTTSISTTSADLISQTASTEASQSTASSIKVKRAGACTAYMTVADDNCWKITQKFKVTQDQIETWNARTWGWQGCGNLQLAFQMCVSAGDPPMPASFSNAICGPLVPGTKPPGSGKSLADLNPCPLKACCNNWGQCGTTGEFCTIKPSKTGAPGTTGCISNCGTDIKKSGPPAKFRTVGYYEAWSMDRECAVMGVREIDETQYNTIHFSFAKITPDLQVDVSYIQQEFNHFVRLTRQGRVLSFGGWSFSTKYDTAPIFRQAVTDGQRQTFANNVAAFVVANNLDGVDFDWEYPGAPDIRGDDGPLPPGGPDDAKNYVRFLQMLRAVLPSGKTISIAAPASYWYLKGFDPLDKFAEVVDYVIFMTYDLHGQWDSGNKWAQPGCESGNCLRSHVNITETENALSMVTKAGFPSNKVVVGVTSYGRSFKMTAAGCTTEMCTYVGGDNSSAKKGRCTQSAGYIANAEIDEIIKTNPSARVTFHEPSKSSIMVYDNTEWVAYMDDNEKQRRAGWVKGMNFGGTSDWAVDLQYMNPPPTNVQNLEISQQMLSVNLGPNPPFNQQNWGDALVVTAVGTIVKSLGNQPQYQFRYDTLRAGQTLDFAFLFEQKNEPHAVSMPGLGAMGASFDINKDGPPKVDKAINLFGRQCTYRPGQNAGDGKIFCSAGISGSTSASSPLHKVKREGPSGGISRRSDVGTYNCFKAGQSMTREQLAAACSAGKCFKPFEICAAPDPNPLRPRGDGINGGGMGGKQDFEFEFAAMNTRPWNIDEITVDWFRRRLREGVFGNQPNANTVNPPANENLRIVFYGRGERRIPGIGGTTSLSDSATRHAEAIQGRTIWHALGNEANPDPRFPGQDHYGINDRNGPLRQIRFPYEDMPEGSYPPDNHSQNVYFRRMSAAIAMESVNEVIVEVPNPRNMGGHWDQLINEGILFDVELRILRGEGWRDETDPRHPAPYRNPNIRRIYATDPTWTQWYIIFDRANDPFPNLIVQLNGNPFAGRMNGGSDGGRPSGSGGSSGSSGSSGSTGNGGGSSKALLKDGPPGGDVGRAVFGPQPLTASPSQYESVTLWGHRYHLDLLG